MLLESGHAVSAAGVLGFGHQVANVRGFVRPSECVCVCVFFSHLQDSLELVFKQSKAVAVTSMAFPLGDVNNFVVGSEDGSVYTACRHGRWELLRVIRSRGLHDIA